VIAAVYGIAVISLLLKRDLLGGGFLILFGLALYTVLRRARHVSMGAKGRLTRDDVVVHPVRVWGFSLNVPSGEFSLSRFEAVGLAERIVVVPHPPARGNTGIVQLIGRPGTPTIDVMTGDIDAARPFAAELSAALDLELKSVATPGQTIRRYTV
jgi:hypothetical protein